MTEPKFQKELEAFDRKKQELLSVCEGKFAVFKGSDFLGVFDTPQTAYEAGINKWGNVPFLIKPVVKEEKPHQIPALFLGLLHAST
ncbi:MAG: hypothetical protein C5B50_24995 [Verrucomicrobia bacterium]|nr:MAG: hypothetical protein C5B50_24995 [Verrucomicrobiota bacterium]